MRTVALTETHYELAQERLYGNAEAVAEWLSGHCIDKTAVGVHHLPNQLEQAPVAELLAIAMFEEPKYAGPALIELRQRYMAEEGDDRLNRYADEACEADEWAGAEA